MPPALQLVYAIVILITEGSQLRMLMAAPNREFEPVNLRLLKSEVAAACADVSHALRGFYTFADILKVLDEVLCLEISNLAKLKLNPEVGDDHPVISYLTASLWFRNMNLTKMGSTSSMRGPVNDRKNVVGAEKQLESMGFCSPDSRERKMAVPDTEAGKHDEQDERKRTSPDHTNLGVSGGSI